MAKCGAECENKQICFRISCRNNCWCAEHYKSQIIQVYIIEKKSGKKQSSISVGVNRFFCFFLRFLSFVQFIVIELEVFVLYCFCAKTEKFTVNAVRSNDATISPINERWKRKQFEKKKLKNDTDASEQRRIESGVESNRNQLDIDR